MHLRLYFFLITLLTASSSFCQYKWIETEISKDISKKIELSVSPEIRFNENSKIQEYFIEPAVTYSINKILKIGMGYRLGYHVNKHDEHEGFGRFAFDLKSRFQYYNFKPSIRIRYTNADDFDDDNGNIDYLRFKLEIAYKIKKLNAEPYILNEWYRDINIGEFSKSRFETGLMYRLSKHHKLGAYYRNNNYITDDKENRNILGLVYKLTL